jgi:hypothetical protein
MILNNKQLINIFSIIDKFHSIFISTHLGTNYLSDEQKFNLKNAGIDLSTFTKAEIVDNAFKFGMLSNMLQSVKNSAKLTYKKFLKFLELNNLPLTADEQFALDSVKQQCYGDITGLGNKVKQDMNNIVIKHSNAQKFKMDASINRLASEAVAKRQTLNKLSSELGHLTKDWSRDFDRISDYIMHSAYQHGRAQNLLKNYGDDVEVYFTVYPKACKHCIRLYLTGDIGSEPIVFKLTDVLSNGNNIGVKSIDWKPSVNPIHPWCRCTLTIKPKDSIWDGASQRYVLVRNTHNVKRKSKVAVKVSYE